MHISYMFMSDAYILTKNDQYKLEIKWTLKLSEIPFNLHIA